VRGVDVVMARAKCDEFADTVRSLMEGYDLLLTPTLPITAFRAGQDYPCWVAGKPTGYLDWTSYTYPFNVTGQPAATVPCGFAADGLPVGLQIVGRWFEDATVLSAAAAFEAARPWAQTRPPIAGSEATT
jgi:aspartyl-tRNA(Asn)/glutamyl-tRNA(Gln) amidotransferase subunit A